MWAVVSLSGRWGDPNFFPVPLFEHEPDAVREALRIVGWSAKVTEGSAEWQRAVDELNGTGQYLCRVDGFQDKWVAVVPVRRNKPAPPPAAVMRPEEYELQRHGRHRPHHRRRRPVGGHPVPQHVQRQVTRLRATDRRPAAVVAGRRFFGKFLLTLPNAGVG